jgi:hypothetical protein
MTSTNEVICPNCEYDSAIEIWDSHSGTSMTCPRCSLVGQTTYHYEATTLEDLKDYQAEYGYKDDEDMTEMPEQQEFN